MEFALHVWELYTRVLNTEGSTCLATVAANYAIPAANSAPHLTNARSAGRTWHSSTASVKAVPTNVRPASRKRASAPSARQGINYQLTRPAVSLVL